MDHEQRTPDAADEPPTPPATAPPPPASRPAAPRAARTRPPSLTHAPVDGIAVFHIGMTIHQLHRPDLWGPVFVAMPRMLAELHRARAAHERGEGEDLGFLHAESMFGATGPWVVQYWKSVEHLYAYARMTEKAHLPAWQRFNQAARRNPGAVGIWHETYDVPASGVETLYGNGAEVGLAKAVGTVPLLSRGKSARSRLTTRLPGERAAASGGAGGGVGGGVGVHTDA